MRGGDIVITGVRGGHCDYWGEGQENLSTALNVTVRYDWILPKVAPTQTYSNAPVH